MKHVIAVCAVSLFLVAGCPPVDHGEPQSAVTARIAASSTQGPVPLTVTFSGAQSSSLNAGALAYTWGFAGDGQAATQIATHTFADPGLYTVTLRVTDAAAEEDVTSIDVRVQGDPPVAAIQADTNSGRAPLLVRFDGRGSYADDDVIRDYAWDFGDGSDASRRPAPSNYYEQAGQFTVTLTVTTAGGVSDTTTTVITVGGNDASLQFDGSQVATLPLLQEVSLPACTFETWFKAGTAGGALVSVGNAALTIEIRPEDNAIRFQIAGTQYETTAMNLSGTWRHVALAYDATNGAALYLDGAALTNVTVNGQEITAGQLTLGMGFVGKAAEARFWSTARSAAAIASDYSRRLAVAGDGMLGYWRLDEGAGQVLTNRAGLTVPGMLGSSAAAEAADPAWSTDGPNLD